MSRRQYQGYSRPRGSWRGRRGSWRGVEADQPETELVDGNHLMVRSTGLYQGGPRSLGVPNVLGSYTIDSELKVQFNDSMMSVLSKEYIPQDNECLQVELDLNRGWHRVNGYTGTTAETYRQLLQWILKNQKRLKAEDSSNKLLADFVCSRGVLKNIMLAPYAGFVNMDIAVLAQCFKGTIYLTYQHEAQEDQKDKEKSSLLEIYGHKFEQYMRGGDPDQVLECNCQFRCVVKQHVNELSLMYSMNTHGTDQAHHKENFTDMSSFVLLRALKECTEPFKQRNYRRFTLCKWWSESQLSGIPRVLKGTRSQDGIVHTLEMLQAADLPDLAEGEWEPSVCINFLAKFLNFVKEKVLTEPDQIHCFERSASAGKYFLHYHANETSILPKWYTQLLFAPEEEQ
ncbi:decapping and exoribonuclease protein-like [Portunus trituberculatus]|uniref:decapping and exoribonuclease protein-like n=1 Tax=Portunus trituberculatus TaxID=210409 RepID=UPI001E1CB2A6|nr:decapping and exoribonuclease protein-like [Portunus trituberculatus]